MHALHFRRSSSTCRQWAETGACARSRWIGMSPPSCHGSIAASVASLRRLAPSHAAIPQAECCPRGFSNARLAQATCLPIGPGSGPMGSRLSFTAYRLRLGDMHDKALYSRTITSLVEYFDGYQTLAVILNVSVNDLRRWSEGKACPPSEVFLQMVDLANGEAARRPGERPRRGHAVGS